MKQDHTPYQEQLRILEKLCEANNPSSNDHDDKPMQEDFCSEENFFSCKLISMLLGRKVAKKWLNFLIS